MRFVSGLCVCFYLLVAGCGKTETAPVGAAPAAPAEGGEAMGAEVSANAESAEVNPVLPASDGALAVPLNPQNTQIEFVGTHTGDKPDPRKGGFDKFTGKLEIDPETKMLKSVSLDIDTESLRTEIDKLTEHLKSPDFFEVRTYPKATFTSTKVQPNAEVPGQLQITGNLTLHGVTKEITAPATVEIGPAGPTLKSEFTLNRSEFGMNYGPDKVEDEVALTVVMGARTASAQP